MEGRHVGLDFYDLLIDIACLQQSFTLAARLTFQPPLRNLWVSQEGSE
jgi:hypothetical protein